MANFKNEAIVNHPVNEVFNIIISAAKRDFPGFTEKKAVGLSVVKDVGSYSLKTGKMKVEITEFKRNNVYAIKSSSGPKVFTSKYTFEKVDENKTKIILNESENSTGFISGINSLVVGVLFKKRVKNRFNYLILGLRDQLETHEPINFDELENNK